MRAFMQTKSVKDLDGDYEQLGCIGRGGFANVFLARKRTSGRKVAIKVMVADDSENEEDWNDMFTRELESVSKLNNKNNNAEERDMSIIFFREYYMLSTIRRAACIVMNYIDGGTLLTEIRNKSSKSPFVPYSERRIGWYILQMADALAFAHERGVAHHDMKSANILIDRSAGGKLILTDFGASVAPGGNSVGFTPAYASPELMRAGETGDCTGLDPVKVDSFGLGCILFELLSCRPLSDFDPGSNYTAFTKISEVVVTGGVDAVLSLPCLRLPLLPAPQNTITSDPATAGYSHSLRNLAAALLEPYQTRRILPSDLPFPLRNEAGSPLLANHLVASEKAVPGKPVTIDNIQLGMLVQRGPHWEDGTSDGGLGAIGVVVNLDADALYTKVVWSTKPSEAASYRIGAGQKFELVAGPNCLPDFWGSPDSGTRQSGVLVSRDPSKYAVGMRPTERCVIVGIRQSEGLILVAPTMKFIPPITASSSQTAVSPEVTFLPPPRDPESHPACWQPNQGLFCEVFDVQERKRILDLFHAPGGGMCPKRYTVVSLQRVQSLPLWRAYTIMRETIATSNWGMANECRLFHGTRNISPTEIAEDPIGFDPRFCDKGLYGRGSYFAACSLYSDKFHHKVNHCGSACRQMFVARVALGRVSDSCCDKDIRRPPRNHHSIAGRATLPGGTESTVHVIYETATQALPEYLITYQERIQYPVSVAWQNDPTATNHNRTCAVQTPVVYPCDACNNAP